MSDFKPVDRSKAPPVRGELLKMWTAETAALEARLRKELTCPNCGFLMATGVPCAGPNGGVSGGQ